MSSSTTRPKLGPQEGPLLPQSQHHRLQNHLWLDHRAFSKVAPVSPALRKFLGAPESSRTDAVKKIWEYIKLHNLQNPADKREIYCDEKLKTIFNGKDKVGFLEIGKLLSAHFVKTD
ncbi:hypothetical protein L1049_018220 [Liquidambar formosana]|uniref:DM2 domain-containing protein n=1 Tax=Liquidambar formosana TaxID=63359 RepID=A0AAP0R9S4_LIQFO